MLKEFRDFAMRGNVAFAVFLLIRNLNKMKKKEEEAPKAPTTKDCPHCCSSIPLKATRCPNCTSEVAAA